MNPKELLEAIVARDIMSRLIEAGVTHEQLATIKATFWKPELLDRLDSWSKRYLEGGHLWGDDPSSCGLDLLDRLGPNSKVLDLAGGYGRDAKAFVDQGHHVLLVDNSQIAIVEAGAVLDEAIQGKMASTMRTDFTVAQIQQGSFDAVSSHRFLHLPSPNHIKTILTRAAGVLKSGGLLALTARSPQDFNPDQMHMVDKDSAVYKDRPTHVVHFYDESRLEKVLSPRFSIFSFSRIEEPESLGNNNSDGSPVTTKLVHVVARKKTDEEIKANGNHKSYFDINRPATLD